MFFHALAFCFQIAGLITLDSHFESDNVKTVTNTEYKKANVFPI